ncbi:Gfo/Idh/MocA family oxidoreductase [Acidobacteria bacterium AH-259-D05]|nr:Gfo/Idh/MocA family oxidoreductase [Acidobacteria bacterium AH-259-D05]
MADTVLKGKKALDMALVGCGAISQTGYLPALSSLSEVRCRCLVDANKSLADKLAKRWSIPESTNDLEFALERVDAVILAVPNHLHAPLSLAALARGKGVLCEKPLARTSDEVHQMVEAARQAGVPLAAAMILRQYSSLRYLQHFFPWEDLGEVREIRGCYGIPLNWPVSNLNLFDPEKSGGGVLIDVGVHLLDALFWTLSIENVEVLEYADDNAGGVEAEARGRLLIKLPSAAEAVPCAFEVSRLTRLSNCLDILGEKASLRVPLLPGEMSVIFEAEGSSRVLKSGEEHVTWKDCFGEQIRSFSALLRGEASTLATGESQIPVLETVEACYARRTPFRLPWQEYVLWG